MAGLQTDMNRHLQDKKLLIRTRR